MRRTVAVITLVLLGLAPALVGQPPSRTLLAVGRRDLRFGTVLPGIASLVRPDAARASGLFEVRGDRFTEVRVEFVLPVTMVSATGQELPLSFGAGDGVAATNRGRFSGMTFDPRQPLVSQLGPSGRLFVRLGGTALPTRQQAGGAYRASIVLTVSTLGT